ncbi:MAG TPA: DUF2785 domain-containing protein [Solirubrobacteraceae bacterium]
MGTSSSTETAFWQSIVESDYAVPDDRPLDAMTQTLLGWLGSTDPTLRDRYAYPILEHWLHAEQYSPDDVRYLIGELAANIPRGLGERDANGVFLRTFSVLMLAEIVHYDNAHQILDEAEIRQMLELGLVYLDAERDLRGWVPGEGWAHSVAHTADLLFVLAQSRHLGATELSRVLDALAQKLAAGGSFYVCGEDDRVARVVVAVIERDLLTVQALRDWLARVVEAATVTDWLDAGQIERRLDVSQNSKQVLRSLFALLALKQGQAPLAAELLQPVLFAAQALAS